MPQKCRHSDTNGAESIGTLLTIVQTGFERKDDWDDVQGSWPIILDALERVGAERRST